ncbi:hypothetical protein CRD60_04680 [Bifidobacterium aemilianum]|uniref:Uncharacterized protein n=1 Tax=Bifidobacterium aemilianum TaxID=2493120 RepID=A0A366K9T2_9BIFI|nr:hypothetical protein [Bifidobacterium aemilianum]RBP97883.1 hypothetical protein CRD60_04680 [Bifidobacterium aemilianum]
MTDYNRSASKSPSMTATNYNLFPAEVRGRNTAEPEHPAAVPRSLMKSEADYWYGKADHYFTATVAATIPLLISLIGIVLFQPTAILLVLVITVLSASATAGLWTYKNGCDAVALARESELGHTVALTSLGSRTTQVGGQR